MSSSQSLVGLGGRSSQGHEHGQEGSPWQVESLGQETNMERNLLPEGEHPDGSENRGESSGDGRSQDGCIRRARLSGSTTLTIAVMGATGSGKSSFLSLCSSQPAEVKDWIGLMAVRYSYDQSSTRSIYLVEIPGFDDAGTGDSGVSPESHPWHHGWNVAQTPLHGIIYLHDVGTPRFDASAKNKLLALSKLCGEKPYQCISFATTRWSQPPSHEEEVREKQLIDTPEFWGDMISKGSAVHRHFGSVRTARIAVERLMERLGQPVVTNLMDEMTKLHQTVVESAAGREVRAKIARERFGLMVEFAKIRSKTSKVMKVADRKKRKKQGHLQDTHARRLTQLKEEQELLQSSADMSDEDRQLREDRAQQVADTIRIAEDDQARNLNSMKESYLAAFTTIKTEEKKKFDAVEEPFRDPLAPLKRKMEFEMGMPAWEAEELQKQGLGPAT